MQFLKTLFWVLLTVLVVLFAYRNWFDVTISLWGNIQADVKIPILVLFGFLLGFFPTWLIMRARLWAIRRKHEALDRQRASASVEEPIPAEVESPVI
jgi:putative membrane protein